uniref:Uncharacterized protein n=1 Tax=Setaria viridis TaxID=4556 RepID=A0A4U6UZF4_SETVI|nr:LOW QUALITY PROTEIN: hypothetical protein SEVIR_4G165300v2 [Setaria viridis]
MSSRAGLRSPPPPYWAPLRALPSVPPRALGALRSLPRLRSPVEEEGSPFFRSLWRASHCFSLLRVASRHLARRLRLLAQPVRLQMPLGSGHRCRLCLLVGEAGCLGCARRRLHGRCACCPNPTSRNSASRNAAARCRSSRLVAFAHRHSSHAAAARRARRRSAAASSSAAMRHSSQRAACCAATSSHRSSSAAALWRHALLVAERWEEVREEALELPGSAGTMPADGGPTATRAAASARPAAPVPCVPVPTAPAGLLEPTMRRPLGKKPAACGEPPPPLLAVRTRAAGILPLLASQCHVAARSACGESHRHPIRVLGREVSTLRHRIWAGELMRRRPLRWAHG